jgi:hypothetical protein
VLESGRLAAGNSTQKSVLYTAFDSRNRQKSKHAAKTFNRGDRNKSRNWIAISFKLVKNLHGSLKWSCPFPKWQCIILLSDVTSINSGLRGAVSA